MIDSIYPERTDDMCDEFVIEIQVKPNANQPIPTGEELAELEKILSGFVDSYLDRLAEDSDDDEFEND